MIKSAKLIQCRAVRRLSDCELFFSNRKISVSIRSLRYLAWMCTAMLPKTCGIRILDSNCLNGFLMKKGPNLIFWRVFRHFIKMFYLCDHEIRLKCISGVLSSVCKTWCVTMKLGLQVYQKYLQVYVNLARGGYFGPFLTPKSPNTVKIKFVANFEKVLFRFTWNVFFKPIGKTFISK